MKKSKKNHGITLVALIIIIIVMLILVGVTVKIAIDGKLFGKAEEAVDKTNEKVGSLQKDVDYYTNLLNKVMGNGDKLEYNDPRTGVLIDWIGLIQTAEGALAETHEILQRMRELTMNLKITTNTDTETDKIHKINEIEQLLSEMTIISTTTEFDKIKLLDGTFSRLVSIDNTTITIGDYSADALNLTSNNLRETLLTEEGLQNYIEKIELAINSVSVARAELGSNQNKFEQIIVFFESKTDIINTYKTEAEQHVIKQQLESIKEALARNKEIAQLGTNETYNDTSRKNMQTEIKTMIEVIKVIIDEEYNGTHLLDGSHCGISKIDLELLGISRHTSIDMPTADDMQNILQDYNTAIQIIEREISKL